MGSDKRRLLAAMFGGLLMLTAVALLVGSGSEANGPLALLRGPTSTPEVLQPLGTPTVVRDSYPAPQQDISAPDVAATQMMTATPAPSQMASLTPVALLTPTQTATAQPTAQPEPAALVSSELARFGVGIARANQDAEAAHEAGLLFGSALNWNVDSTALQAPVEFWQMVRLDEGGIRFDDWLGLAEAIAVAPGSTYLVGNEPDVKWQDNLTPQRYAEIYHDVYTFIKERDPSSRIAIGGVSQPTPLRRAYLDIVLDTYESAYGEPMPIDIWNVHNFILREEAGSWGVDIPPGMDGAEGILYEIDDHDDMEIFTQNLRDFRAWMTERGYGGYPLVISEYGILMPEDYGFSPERVTDFMIATFDLFREARGADGYPEDDNRLVQWWFWYSVYDGEVYSTGNLWDSESGDLTPLGEAWSRYVADYAVRP